MIGCSAVVVFAATLSQDIETKDRAIAKIKMRIPYSLESSVRKDLTAEVAEPHAEEIAWFGVHQRILPHPSTGNQNQLH